MVKKTVIVADDDNIELAKNSIQVEGVNLPMTDEPEPDDAEIELNNVLAELGGNSDAKINVYQISNGRKAFVGAFTPGDFSLESIQLNYGGGDYEVQVRVSGRFVKRKTLTIAKPIVAPGDKTGDIMQGMLKGFEMLSQQLNQALSPREQKSTRDTLEELMLMKEIFASSAPVEAKTGELDLFLKGIEFAKETLPKDGETGFSDIALEAIKALPNLAAHQSAPVTSTMPAPPARQPAPLQSNPIPENENMDFLFKMYLNTLVKHAKNNHDPELYAEVVLDTVGDETALKFVERDDWYLQLIKINPEVEQHQQWFYQLRQHILVLTTEDDGDTKPETDTGIPDAG